MGFEAHAWMFDNEIDWVIYYKAEQGFVSQIWIVKFR